MKRKLLLLAMMISLALTVNGCLRWQAGFVNAHDDIDKAFKVEDGK